MSSDALVPVPRTAVPLGIADPVVQARTELKAALAAIEEKANVPRRAGRALDAVIVSAAAVGAAVWGFVRLYTR